MSAPAGPSSARAAAGAGPKVACIGDINRQRSQNGRPGGTVCIENEMLWAAFYKAIVKADSCSRRR